MSLIEKNTQSILESTCRQSVRTDYTTKDKAIIVYGMKHKKTHDFSD